MSVKVRIAPSPTGLLHVGTARTALFNWLFARKHGGEFLVRIEDTDTERSEKRYEEDILNGLKWLGLESDSSVVRQSERLDVYEKYLRKLFDEGKVFWCHHTKEELEAEKNAQMANKEHPRHVCEHKRGELKTQNSKLKTGEGILRLRVDEGSERKVVFDDVIRGKIEWEEKNIGDVSVAKDFNEPLYNFSNVVDDIEMEITHVIRGEDHISNTPKQILIYEAINSTQNLGPSTQMPVFAHLPLILGADRSKLSKRHGAVSLAEYEKDYLPGAFVNFMGFLGYTYSKEILSKEEMAKEFELEKVHKSGAIFDVKKLNWLNAQYVRKLAPVEFKKVANAPDLPDAAVSLVTERLETLRGVGEFRYLWQEPEYGADLLVWKKSDAAQTQKALEQVKNEFRNIREFNLDTIRDALERLSAGDRGPVYWPLRVALSGKEKSPGPVELANALGKASVLKRINIALTKLEVAM